MLKLFIKDTTYLYTSSTNLERTLNYLNQIGLTKKIESLFPHFPNETTYKNNIKSFTLSPLPTNKIPNNSESSLDDLTDKVLYHVTRNKKAWDSIRSRKDGSINALIKYTGPWKGFYFTTSSPKKQYGDYVVAFKISNESVYRNGDKPNEYFLVNGRGSKIIEYKTDPTKKEFTYLNYSLNELVNALPKKTNLLNRETETLINYMSKMRAEYKNLEISDRKSLLKRILIDLNDEAAPNIFSFIKYMKLGSEELNFVLKNH